MTQAKTFYVFMASCLVVLLLLVGLQLKRQPNIKDIGIVNRILPAFKRQPTVDPLAPANAKLIDLTYNPFTLDGHAFWSTVVGTDITPGIFDDCKKISNSESNTKRLIPKVFYDEYDPFMSVLTSVLGTDKRPEGTSLAYPEEGLVLWNIITKVPYIKTVCETGFNTGEGTLLWLAARPDVHVYSFDLGSHDYARPMANHIQELYPGRHNIIWGDSTKTLPKFVKENPGIRCDIIYVDGGHTYEISKTDFDNFYELGYSGSVVILDNYPDYRLTFMKDLGGMWEDNRRMLNILEIFKCTYGRIRNQGFSFGLLTKPRI